MLIEEVDRSVKLRYELDLGDRIAHDNDSLGDRITIARALSQ